MTAIDFDTDYISAAADYALYVVAELSIVWEDSECDCGAKEYHTLLECMTNQDRVFSESVSVSAAYDMSDYVADFVRDAGPVINASAETVQRYTDPGQLGYEYALTLLDADVFASELNDYELRIIANKHHYYIDPYMADGMLHI